MAEQPWGDYANDTVLADSDILLVARGAGGVNIPGSSVLGVKASGNFETMPSGSLGLIIAKNFFSTLAGDATRSLIGAMNSGLGAAAGSLMLQPRVGVTASIVFATEGTIKALITSNGDIGVGTLTPASYAGYKALTIEGATNGGAVILRNTANTASIEMAATPSESYVKTVGAQALWFGTNNINRMRIDTSGNVGIGTANNPIQANLDISTLSVGAVTLGIRIGYVSGFYGFRIVNESNASSFSAGKFHIQRGTSAAWINAFSIDNSGHVNAGVDNTQTLGSASLRWSVVYAGTGTINTSDERAKTDIGEIPNAWLDAWADVQWQRFKMIDGKRWHVGLVAQQVHAAFAAHDLDAFEIGLCCFDKWDEVREPIYATRSITEQYEAPSDEIYKSGPRKGEPKMETLEREIEESYDTGETRVTLEAGDRWGLRYDECQAIEAAWQRREISRLHAALAALGA